MSFNIFTSDWLYCFFDRTLEKLGCGALLTPEGELLHLRYETLTDIGTLPVACQIVNKYLNLGDGEMALINDPYSGGTLLSYFTLIVGCSLNKKNKKSDLLLALRFSTKPKLTLENSIDKEGIRIPPTPIAFNGKPIQETISAITSNSQCPPDFLKQLNENIHLLEQTRREFLALIDSLKIVITKPLLRKYFEESLMIIRDALGEFKTHETHVKTKLDEGEIIKLDLFYKGDILHFDYSGTSVSKKTFLTHPAVCGITFGALLSLLNKPYPINFGTLQIIEVITSKGSLLNSQYPSPVFRGFTDGASRLANLVITAMGDLSPKFVFAESGVCYCPIEILFSDRSYYFDLLEGGSGASHDRNGVDGISLWSKHRRQPSIEEVEKRFFLLIKSITVKSFSGGTGNQMGGNGLVKSYEIISPVQFTWRLEQTKIPAQGRVNGKSGSTAEIYLLRKGQREKLSEEGMIELQKGDIITIHSPGGGGVTL